MHQTTHFFAGRSQTVSGAGTNDHVKCFGSSQVMADGADAAKALNENRSFPIGTALNKTFKSAEFNNMKT
ncbi:hypothetical protein SDC9_82167 [bioreactor metagenome]|uniref:Uncharacterized protein n=1 Tax=bioreactor metagenome TaxID=1076179 RepID=A0A644ZCG4_9ZZZZ